MHLHRAHVIIAVGCLDTVQALFCRRLLGAASWCLYGIQWYRDVLTLLQLLVCSESLGAPFCGWFTRTLRRQATSGLHVALSVSD